MMIIRLSRCIFFIVNLHSAETLLQLIKSANKLISTTNISEAMNVAGFGVLHIPKLSQA